MHNKFPEVFNRNKTIDVDGYPVYRRRNGGRYIEQGEVMLQRSKDAHLSKTSGLLMEWSTHHTRKH
jgi:hypothetical protein